MILIEGSLKRNEQNRVVHKIHLGGKNASICGKHDKMEYKEECVWSG